MRANQIYIVEQMMKFHNTQITCCSQRTTVTPNQQHDGKNVDDTTISRHKLCVKYYGYNIRRGSLHKEAKTMQKETKSTKSLLGSRTGIFPQRYSFSFLHRKDCVDVEGDDQSNKLPLTINHNNIYPQSFIKSFYLPLSQPM